MRFLNFIVLLFALPHFSLSQPYAQITYSYSGVSASSGCRTFLNSDGHLTSGYRTYSPAGTYNFCMNKTDAGGTFTTAANLFNMRYQIWHNGSCTTGTNTQILNCNGVSAIETFIPGTPDAWYAAAGTYDNGCFFITLDSNGNVLNSKVYLFPYTNANPAKALISESKTTPTDYYICSTHDTTVFVLKVNSTGAVLWSSYYNVGNGNFFMPKAIMECPFTGDAIVIGSVNPTLGYGTGTDGFVLRLNNGNGNIISYKAYTIPSGACQEFSSIKPANSLTGGQGYIIGGSTDQYPAMTWILKIGIGGNIIWTTVIQPNVSATRIVDVIERPTPPTYEYYGIAESLNGMLVMKLNDAGVPFTSGNNEFIYNIGTLSSSPVNIDFQNTGSNIALTSYGVDDLSAGNNLYMVRSYFNGASGCNETLGLVNNYYQGPDSVFSPWINQFGSLSACNNFLVIGFGANINANVLCNNTILGNGNNSWPTVVEALSNNLNGVSVYPNPTNEKIILEFDIIRSGESRMQLFNNLGQELSNEKEFLAIPGHHSRELNFEKLNLESGIYFIILNVNEIITRYKVIYNK
jgi:hypothetical protein